MAKLTKVTGVQEVLRNLDKTSTAFGKRLEASLIRTGLWIQRESMKIVPVDTGNLKASAFTRRVEGTSGLNTVVFVGFTAAYAIYVHENLEAAHGEAFNAKYAQEIAQGLEHRRGKNQQAKFLEYVVRKHQKEILRRIGQAVGQVFEEEA